MVGLERSIIFRGYFFTLFSKVYQGLQSRDRPKINKCYEPRISVEEMTQKRD